MSQIALLSRQKCEKLKGNIWNDNSKRFSPMQEGNSSIGGRPLSLDKKSNSITAQAEPI